MSPLSRPLIASLVLSLQLGAHRLHAQYLENRDEFMAPTYVRHNPVSNHRQSSIPKTIPPVDDLSSSQSLFMVNFKRQAILSGIPEASEKSSKSLSNRENHTVIEKYIIDANSPEYQQLIQKMVSAEKRPSYYLSNQGMASSRSTTTTNSKGDGDEAVERSGDTESSLLKQGHKFMQAPYEASSTNYHQPISKLSIELEKKETGKYATLSAPMFDDRIRPPNGTLNEEQVVKHLQIQLRASLETLLAQLNDLKERTEHEIQKLEIKSESKGRSLYDTELRKYDSYNIHYLPTAKYDSTK